MRSSNIERNATEVAPAWKGTNTRLVRLREIIGEKGGEALVPVSASTWWAGVASGRFPKPIKLGPRCTAWRLTDIERLINFGTEAFA